MCVWGGGGHLWARAELFGARSSSLADVYEYKPHPSRRTIIISQPIISCVISCVTGRSRYWNGLPTADTFSGPEHKVWGVYLNKRGLEKCIWGTCELKLKVKHKRRDQKEMIRSGEFSERHSWKGKGKHHLEVVLKMQLAATFCEQMMPSVSWLIASHPHK